MRRNSVLVRLVAAVVVAASGVLVAVTTTTAPAAAAPPTTPVLTADAQPSWQTNGVVWAMEEVNGVLYVGGNFSSVRPPGAARGTGEVARDNLAAFDATTGALLPFSHRFTAPTFTYTGTPDHSCNVDYTAKTYTCDTVYRIERSPDGSKIYVGGDFVWIDGKDRRKMGAFLTANAKTANNALDTGFKNYGTNGRVRAMAVTASTVYVGGEFTATGSPAVTRTRLAAFNGSNGALLPWAPTATSDGAPPDSGTKSFKFTPVLVMEMSPDDSRVIVGGNFFSLNGTSIHGLAAVDAATGARTAWSGHFVVPPQSFITDLTTDADTVYVAADGYGTFDGRYATNPYTGQQKWVDWCRGATSGLAVMGDILYSGSHAHNCQHPDGAMPGGFPEQAPFRWYRLLAESTQDGTPQLQYWFPSTNGGDPAIPASQSISKQGVRSMLTVGNTVWIGGQFTLVNDRPQQGLTRFTRSTPSFQPTRPERPWLASTAPGAVHVSWRGSLDLDDEVLTYELFRGTTLIHTTPPRSSKPWQTQAFSYTDSGLTPGTSVTYQVRAKDSRGTYSTKSFTATTTVASGTQRYPETVLADSPSDYWRMDNTAGPTLTSLAGPAATAGSTVAYNQPGGIPNQPSNTSVYLDGTTSSRIIGKEVTKVPDVVSIELSFRAPLFSQGKLIGFGNRNSFESTAYDRHLYLDTSGRLNWGVSNGVANVITTPGAMTDNAWHHVVATFGPAGMALYVDGALVGTRSTVTTGSQYEGVWRIGGDRLTGWPNASGFNYKGNLDDISVYPRQLSEADALRHYQAR
ncbi:MAG TPA: LamG-like jellyroll fold domain-containing protein [Cryptosporangiaceae bacterium]|nr:LamG-like jellyroll fold domain-containing protein [Cryptosporangiaceae bacterium]